MIKRDPYDSIKSWMVLNHVDQKKFAEALGTSVSYINRKLNGTGPDFKLSEARKLVQKFGFPFDYFFTIEVPIKELGRKGDHQCKHN